MPREPLVPSNPVALTICLPRPRGAHGIAKANLPVPDLMSIRGVTLGAPFGTSTAAFAGWRLHVLVADATLVDGAALASVDRLCQTTGQPVRHGQIVILTPRDPVDVVVGVEWVGRGRPRRLPRGLDLTIRGGR